VCCRTSTVTVGVSTALERVNLRNVNMKCEGLGLSNPGGPVAQATRFCAVALKICVCSVWNMLQFFLLAYRILRWLLEFWKIFAPPDWLLKYHTWHIDISLVVLFYLFPHDWLFKQKELMSHNRLYLPKQTKLSLYTSLRHVGGMAVLLHPFLTSALIWGEWLAFILGHFFPGDRTPGTHWVGGWMGCTAGLGILEKR